MAKSTVYEIITEQFVKALEEDMIPWKQPYRLDSTTGRRVCGFPEHRNPASGSVYRGINVLLCEISAMRKGYKHPLWLTFNQIKKQSGTVKKGEKSTIITFWKKLNGRKCSYCKGEGCSSCGYSGKYEPMMLRYYRVFNIAQTTLEQPAEPEVKPASEELVVPESSKNQKIESAEEILRAYFEYSCLASNRKDRPEVINGDGEVPCYMPLFDKIRMPGIDCFDSSESYYSTFFHEQIHSTGTKNRVPRAGIESDMATEFRNGKQEYSFEELVAEIGATYLCNKAGIMQEVIENAKAYCQNWAKHLKSNPKWIVQASSKSTKAVDYVLGV